jgi:hypothetical protein
MMNSRRSIVVVEGFYQDPTAVRNYALRQSYYTPYETEQEIQAGAKRPTWWASRFRNVDDCPVKSSGELIAALETAVGETIDMDHWRAPFGVDQDSRPLIDPAGPVQTCLWNCCFHVKPDNKQCVGGGVHNHVTDRWNSVGPGGWAGIIYLNPTSPADGGLHLWRNKRRGRQFNWMTPANNWELIDSFGNIFNRLLLVRGDIPHSGAGGWGSRVEDGRMFQTFFFKTLPTAVRQPVLIPQIG